MKHGPATRTKDTIEETDNQDKVGQLFFRVACSLFRPSDKLQGVQVDIAASVARARPQETSIEKVKWKSTGFTVVYKALTESNREHIRVYRPC